MIRSTYDRRLGALPAFDPISAGISAAVGLASAAIGAWTNSIQLSHNADTATTLIVNGLGSQLSNLDAAYLAEPNVSCADQRTALDAYDQAWQWLQSPVACGNPTYGQAGNKCISDRAPGGKYPWTTYYRTPIANDPRLINAGCDTTQEVLLPSLATGTYQATGITAGAGSDTGSTAATPTATSAAAAISPSVVTGIPNTYLLLGAALLAFLAIK